MRTLLIATVLKSLDKVITRENSIVIPVAVFPRGWLTSFVLGQSEQFLGGQGIHPGLGFGKKGAQNRALLRDIAIFHGLGCPILLGASRKGVTGGLERAVPPGDRLPGSLAAALWARSQGVQVLRVHDVAETRQALAVWDAIAAR